MTTELSTNNISSDTMSTSYSLEETQALSSTSTVDSEEARIQASRLAAWMRDQARINAFFNEPGAYISQFWQQYKSIFLLAIYAILALIAINFFLTIIGFVMSIPLISGLLELVGIGYSIWFTNRYLLSAEKRQELSQKFEQIKQDIFGSKPEDMANEAAEVVDTIATDAKEMSDSTLVNSL